MPVSLANAALFNNAISHQLDAFTNLPMPEKSTSNTGQAAWRLFLAQRMSAYAEAFKKKAMADAVSAGVIFDHSKKPRDAGVDEDIYAGDIVRVHLLTKNGSQRLDTKKLGNTLVSQGMMPQEVWDDYVAQCTTQNAAPHTFTASLRT